MIVVLPQNLHKILIKTSSGTIGRKHSQTLYQNFRKVFYLKFAVNSPSVSENCNAESSTRWYCQRHINMPKRRLVQNAVIFCRKFPKVRKVEGNQKAMGNVCCKRSEETENNGECTEQTTLLSSQTDESKMSSNERLISEGTNKKHSYTEVRDERGTLESAHKTASSICDPSRDIESKTAAREDTAENAAVCESDVNVHTVDDASRQILIDIHSPDDRSVTDDGNQHHVTLLHDEGGKSSQTNQQSGIVSLETQDNQNENEKRSKPTVLPQQLLENITSLVSEKCETEENWLQNALGEQSDSEETSELLGNIFSNISKEKDDFANKVSGADLPDDAVSEERGHKRKKEKAKKPRPNYFVAVQITNPEIHSGLCKVQLAVLSANSKMKEVMIKLPTIHLTILVLSLQTDEEIKKASQALDECGHELRERLKDNLPVMEVSGVGTFRNQVVFAKVTPGDALDQLMNIHVSLKEKMSSRGILPTDDSSLTPHITIMKMSKVKGYFRKKVAKKIDPDLYDKFKDMTFGTETVKSLQLCSMEKPKDSVGYYYVEHQVYLGQGEVTLNQFSQRLVQSVLVSALERVKQDNYKRGTAEETQQEATEKQEKSQKRKFIKKTKAPEK